jgi:hypothetical protein
MRQTIRFFSSRGQNGIHFVRPLFSLNIEWHSFTAFGDVTAGWACKMPMHRLERIVPAHLAKKFGCANLCRTILGIIICLHYLILPQLLHPLPT